MRMQKPEQTTSVGRYICLVVGRSFRAWRGDEGWLAFTSYGFVFAAIVALSGSAFDLVNATIGNYVAYFAMLWLALLIVIITPYRLWKEISLEYNKLQDTKDYEKIVDQISELFDYGNSKILNRQIENYEEYTKWKTDWTKWQSQVENYLSANLGLAEKICLETT